MSNVGGRFNLDFLSTKAGQIVTVGGLVLAIWLFLWPVFEPGLKEKAREWISDEIVAQCVIFPATGHIITSTPPGEWATITWRNINRIDPECGTPTLTAVVVNGDGVFHSVPLSITGINLDAGTTSELKYQFQVPPSAKPGAAWFRVTLDYHMVGRSINSPRVNFTIPKP